MSSTIQVQRTRGAEPQPAGIEGARLLVESTVDRISLVRSEGATRSPRAKFDFDIDMTESGRAGDILRVRYSFLFKRLAAGEFCSVSGRAALRLAGYGADTDLSQLDGDTINMIAVEIFRRNYESVYLLHGALGMEAPSPWITEDVFFSQPHTQ